MPAVHPHIQLTLAVRTMIVARHENCTPSHFINRRCDFFGRVFERRDRLRTTAFGHDDNDRQTHDHNNRAGRAKFDDYNCCRTSSIILTQFKEKPNGHNPVNCYNSFTHWRAPDLAIQRRLGLLPYRWSWPGSSNRPCSLPAPDYIGRETPRPEVFPDQEGLFRQSAGLGNPSSDQLADCVPGLQPVLLRRENFSLHHQEISWAI